MKQYKNNVDRPVGAILSLNTIAHTIGSAGVGAESMKLFGEEYFGLISAILTLLILVLSEIIPKTVGASYWRSLAMPSTKIIRVLIFITYPLVLLSELITKVFTPKNHQASVSREEGDIYVLNALALHGRGAAQQGAHPGQKLLRGEGLRQIVVGPGIQPRYPVAHGRQGRQQYYGTIAAPAPVLPQNLHTVHSG